MSKKKKKTAKSKPEKSKKQEEKKSKGSKGKSPENKSKKKSSEKKSEKKSDADKEKKASVTINKPDLDNLSTELKKFYKFLKEKHILSNVAWVLAFLISLTVMDYAFQYWNNDLSVAIVGGKRISRNEYIKRTQQLAGLQATEELVREELFRLKAQQEGVEVTDEEVQEAVEQDIKTVGGEEELKKLIEDYPAMNMETYREDIRVTLLEFKLFKRYLDVTDDELKQFFESNKQYLFPEQEDVKFEDKKEEVKEIYLDYKFANDVQTKNEWYASLQDEFVVRNNFTDDVSYGFMKATRQAYQQFIDQVTGEEEQDSEEKVDKEEGKTEESKESESKK